MSLGTTLTRFTGMGGIIGGERVERYCTLGIAMPLGRGGTGVNEEVGRPISRRRVACQELLGDVNQLGQQGDLHLHHVREPGGP